MRESHTVLLHRMASRVRIISNIGIIEIVHLFAGLSQMIRRVDGGVGCHGFDEEC